MNSSLRRISILAQIWGDMTIGLTQEHRDLRDAVRAFASRHVTAQTVRAAVDAGRDAVPPFWKALAEQGLLGLHLPEDSGGGGFGVVELAVVTEELGRVLAPGPFLPTTLAGAVLHKAGHTEYLEGLAEGTTIGAVGLRPGGLTLSREAGRTVVRGTFEPVLGGQVADLFVLPATDGDTTAWVVLPREAVRVVDMLSHDPTRRPARVTADDVTVPDGAVLTGPTGLTGPTEQDVPVTDQHVPVTEQDVLVTEQDVPVTDQHLLDQHVPVLDQHVLDLAAVLFAAEASGLADRCTTTAAEYAKVREQFGRPIGQFQGVKHRCARMLARAEQARACAWDAARAQEPGTDPGEASLAAAVAGATSVEAAFGVAKDCINTLGGIGFTWEHEAGFYLRRAQTLRILLGSTSGWRRRVARLTLDGVRRELGVDLPPEAEEVRARVRAELEPAKALPGTERTTYLAEHGYTAPHLPEPWGKGADAVSQLVIAEELKAAGLRPYDMIIGNWVVPTLIAHGDPALHEPFLPATLRGDLIWCQLFSEPGAGSDLAGLSTRAEKVDGGWKITGQKVWTSMARQADWGILLARTDPAAPKHKGLSYFLLDMSAPGIDIRPLRELTGEELFNEVFLDGVFIPDEMLVGAPGEGWKLARTTLSNERVSLGGGSSLGSAGETLLELVAGDPAGADAARLTELGDLLCEAQSNSLFGLRTTLRSLVGGGPGAEASIGKLIGAEHMQRAWETAMDWTGYPAVCTDNTVGEGEGLEGRDVTWRFLSSRNMTIAGGTTDVQLNIIGERLLGLPR